MDLYQRSAQDLNPKWFGVADPAPKQAFAYRIKKAPEAQRVLRMCLKTPHTTWMIPEQLAWLEGAIEEAVENHQKRGLPAHGFVYVTVRRGPVVDTTDDQWHVDGFSMRIPHRPEQNYIFSDRYGTEWLNQKITLPEDFDGMRHNIHSYFQSHADPEHVSAMSTGHFYLIDPYVIHRRPSLSAGLDRTFIRISFIPVEIEDDRNTPNPLLERPRFNRADVRDVLVDYDLLNIKMGTE
jgi:hypothetical protein